MPLRVIFMGTPEFSVPTLKAIAAEGHDVAAVYTQPPRPAGRRGMKATKSPVHHAAEELGVEVRTPASLKEEAEQENFRAPQADVAVVVAYGLLLPKQILEAPLLGCYNGHASLLPRWRGAAPIQRAVEAGDTETAMVVMKMGEGLDTGPVAMVRKVAIGPYMTAGELHDRLMDVGARLMTDALAALDAEILTLSPQPEDGVTYAKKIDKAETRIDWTRPARQVHDKIRGFSPVPGTWSEMEIAGKAERVKLLRAIPGVGSGEAGEVLDDRLTVACGAGAVQLMELQRAGGKPMTAEEFLHGAKLAKGARLA